jgi:hypothetical protein
MPFSIRIPWHIIMLSFFAVATSRCGSDQDRPWYGDAPGDNNQGDQIVNPDPEKDPQDDGPVVDQPVIPDTPWENICGEENLPLQYNVSSDVLIVLDRSGSMMGILDNVKVAINTVVDASDDKIWFGLMPFPNSVPPNDCRLIAPLTECAPPVTPHVALGPNRAPDIASAMSTLRVCGSTPTTVTLRNAHAYLSSAATGHTMYVLLATDGVPNCNGDLDGNTCTCLDTESGCADNPLACLDDEAAYVELDDLLADGIKTYVLGMGSGLMAGDIDVMNSMAEHGGTGSFYPAETPAELLAAFEAIMGTVVVSCLFDLNPGADTDPTKVNIYVDGEIVPQTSDYSNGWNYVDEDTIEFYGPWCDRILSGDVSGVGATYGCPTYII